MDVRPQWTPWTTAGRAKLMVDSDNWDWADSARELRGHRERYVAELHTHVELEKAYKAAVQRDECKEALLETREMLRQQQLGVARVARAESDALRRQATAARENWKQRGKHITVAQDDERLRAQLEREQMARERSSRARLRLQERERHQRECGEALRARIQANRERAERIRSNSARGLSSSSASELQGRMTSAERIRQAERRNEMARLLARKEDLDANRSQHDNVVEVSSPSRVRVWTDELTAHKARQSASVRQESALLHEARLLDRLADEARKQAIRDTVRRAHFHGQEEVALPNPPSVGRSSSTGSLSVTLAERAQSGLDPKVLASRSPAARWLRQYAGEAQQKVSV